VTEKEEEEEEERWRLRRRRRSSSGGAGAGAGAGTAAGGAQEAAAAWLRQETLDCKNKMSKTRSNFTRPVHRLESYALTNHLSALVCSPL
jgi:hypothetical protein